MPDFTPPPAIRASASIGAIAELLLNIQADATPISTGRELSGRWECERYVVMVVVNVVKSNYRASRGPRTQTGVESLTADG